MIVYVESNFVLEIALEQEQHINCQTIMTQAEQGALRLVLPAFSIAEPYESIVRRARDRSRLASEFAKEIQQLTRSKSYQTESDVLTGVTGLLVRSVEDEKRRLDQTVQRLLDVAEVIPLEREILRTSFKAQQELGLSPQDAIVYASIMHHLSTTNPPVCCFLNRNSRDFDDPDIIAQLNLYHCKMFVRFDHAEKYILSQIGL